MKENSERIFDCAQDAIISLALGNREEYASHMARLCGEYGPYGIQMAIMLWVDTLTDIIEEHLKIEKAEFFPVWYDKNGPIDVFSVEPKLRWAMQIIAARANMDRETFTALVAVASESDQLGQSVDTLADIIAATLVDMSHSAPDTN